MHPIANHLIWELFVLPRPRGGDWLETEDDTWTRRGLRMIVCLLTDDEIDELSLQAEADACAAHGIEFVRHPIDDRGVPDSSVAFDALVAQDAGELARGVAVGIHCRMDIARSTLLAACVLRYGGVPRADIWSIIGRARGCHVPDTAEQARWVDQWAESIHR